MRRYDGAVIAEAGPVALRLRSPVALEERDSAATGVFEVAAGSRFSFSVAHATAHDERPFDDPDIDDALANAEQAWASEQMDPDINAAWRLDTLAAREPGARPFRPTAEGLRSNITGYPRPRRSNRNEGPP